MSGGDIQASVRAVTGTALDYDGDWEALFDLMGVPTAYDWNGRMLAWINANLGTTYPDVTGAMQAFAAAQGVFNWDALGTFSPLPAILTPSGAPLLTPSGSVLQAA